MPTSFFEEVFSRLFGIIGTVIGISLGNPRQESGPEILLIQHFDTDNIIFADTAFIDIDGPIANRSFRLGINDHSDQINDSCIPDIVRRFFRIDGIQEIEYRSPNDTTAVFPKIKIQKASMFSWNDILPQVRKIITHPNEPLFESFTAVGRNIGTLIDIVFSLAIGQEDPVVRCKYWEGCNVADDDDRRGRVYANLSKRLLQQGNESFDQYSKPGFFNPLARRLLNIDGVERVVIVPYCIAIYIHTPEVWTTRGDEIRMMIKKFA